MKKTKYISAICFLCMVLIVGGIYIGQQNKKIRELEIVMDASYRQSFYALSDYVANISAALDKGLYCATPVQAVTLASDVWRYSGAAKESLSVLPLNQGEAEKLSTYLSQVGDYVYSLSRNILIKREITPEEREILRQLLTYCQSISTQLSAMERDIDNGNLSILQSTTLPCMSENFATIEEEFSQYPTLIYDGPFSSHLSEKESAFLYGIQNVSKEDALQKASDFLGLDAGLLTFQSEAAGSIPQYTFSFKAGFISMSIPGGYPITMSQDRTVSKGMDITQAIETARVFLESVGFLNMKDNYYSISNNIATINFAYTENDITIYPDLIKVSVALDDGQIMSFDSTTYLMNHVESRAIGKIEVSADTAIQMVPGDLTVLSTSLCIIPSAGQYELFCHELKCSSPDGKTYLIYINAYTGIEEKILILLEQNNSILTI